MTQDLYNLNDMTCTKPVTKQRENKRFKVSSVLTENILSCIGGLHQNTHNITSLANPQDTPVHREKILE